MFSVQSVNLIPLLSLRRILPIPLIQRDVSAAAKTVILEKLVLNISRVYLSDNEICLKVHFHSPNWFDYVFLVWIRWKTVDTYSLILSQWIKGRQWNHSSVNEPP